MTEPESGVFSAPERTTEMRLDDEWGSDQPIVLSGPLERSGFPPWMTMLIGLVLAFILFQGISLVASFVMLAANGVSLSTLPTSLGSLLEEYASELIVSNTIGQILGLLIPALIFARLHTRNKSGFLRLRGTDFRLILLSVVGLIALIPVVQWTGTVFDALPWPDFIRDFEQAQMDLIEKILLQDFSLTFTLSMMALTPAICEEVLFRGYIQRQAERSMGIWGGILFSGIIFGLYHLRLTQAVPLAILGAYLAYLTWRSGSLVPAIVVHFANNAFAVILSKFGAEWAGVDVDIESFQVPWEWVILSLFILVGITYSFHKVAGMALISRSTE